MQFLTGDIIVVTVIERDEDKGRRGTALVSEVHASMQNLLNERSILETFNSNRSTDISRGCIFTAHCVIASGSYAEEGCSRRAAKKEEKEDTYTPARRRGWKRVKVEIRRL